MGSLVDGFNFDKRDAYDKVTFTDLFFWALASGQPQMVELLWGRVDDPLRCSVVAVEACRRIRKRCFSRGRGKPQQKRLLDTIERRLEDGMIGILDNISGVQVARTILLESYSPLGLKRGTSHLLYLGTRLRSRELVTHDLSQGVLDDQWCGRDPKSGRVAFRLDNVRLVERIAKLLVLSLIGWTGLGGMIVPIVPNDYSRRLNQHRRATRVGRGWHAFLMALNIYRVPCVKHTLQILSSTAHFIAALPFAMGNPRAPLDVYDVVVCVYFLSAAMHEMRQLRRAQKLGNVYEYFESNNNRFDLMDLALKAAVIFERLIGALVLGCSPGDDGAVHALNHSAVDGIAQPIDLTPPTASSCAKADASLADAYTWAFRMTVTVFFLTFPCLHIDFSSCARSLFVCMFPLFS